ncbi:uncharacterized protein AMSG_04206 [Thecamonas trahens ATCC 50062]|uniref:Uncharacterized protein n=1 Tax=Thecamonas trahens ATCC 50062 TaxID=461836 RepID=A0A0L0D6G1_THETB|nr:hypothetical protein AMSG_04206 [Thecamonas trahens ATCC 50062]KNC47972.1 hypothetical protein AMSG_04206 [Thecamonas trahens ATCC 50062]|eukprot:XP_013758989.1 hypothetical protein AMSG_04206 [Thecamonas trahens ATCC 50062]
MDAFEWALLGRGEAPLADALPPHLAEGVARGLPGGAVSPPVASPLGGGTPRISPLGTGWTDAHGDGSPEWAHLPRQRWSPANDVPSLASAFQSEAAAMEEQYAQLRANIQHMDALRASIGTGHSVGGGQVGGQPGSYGSPSRYNDSMLAHAGGYGGSYAGYAGGGGGGYGLKPETDPYAFELQRAVDGLAAQLDEVLTRKEAAAAENEARRKAISELSSQHAAKLEQVRELERKRSQMIETLQAAEQMSQSGLGA